jgi:DNA-binding MarR family transcriptional regulator
MMSKRSSLRDEIKQTRPFRNASEEATLSILRTATLVRRGIAAVVGSFDITPAQYNVLRILRGSADAGLPTLAVRDRLIEEAPGITRLLDKLESSGLVRRDRSMPDRRQVICFITVKGLALLKKIDPRIVDADQAGGAGLTPAERRQLIVLLEKVRGSMLDLPSPT